MPYRLRITKEEVRAELEKMGHSNLDEEIIESFRNDMLRLIKDDLRKIKRKKTQNSSPSCSFAGTSSQPLLTSTPNTYSDLEMEKEARAKFPQEERIATDTDAYHSDYESSTTLESEKTSSSLRRVKSLGSGICESSCSEISRGPYKRLKDKGTASHIKPKKPKDLQLPPYPEKPDPVNLYHFYKAHWDKFKPPGEDPRAPLRWQMRAKLHYPS